MDPALLALHVLFYVPFLVRMLGSGTRPNAGLIAPRVRWTLLLMSLGFGTLYAGLCTAPGAPGVLPRRLGGGIILAATALVVWALLVFRSWRLLPKIDPGHELCTRGPYAWVRHPIYLACDLLALGSLLWIPSPVVLAALALMVLGGDLRARLEEQVLLEAFGDAYRDYMGRVKRFIPGVY